MRQLPLRSQLHGSTQRPLRWESARRVYAPRHHPHRRWQLRHFAAHLPLPLPLPAVAAGLCWVVVAGRGRYEIGRWMNAHFVRLLPLLLLCVERKAPFPLPHYAPQEDKERKERKREREKREKRERQKRKRQKRKRQMRKRQMRKRQKETKEKERKCPLLVLSCLVLPCLVALSCLILSCYSLDKRERDKRDKRERDT
jgi:hypothetical protein